jgi:pimeloyl-ACP methyl ester carboxylesterase
MIDSEAYVRRLNAAEPAELAAMLVRPTAEEERVLVTHLGRERFDRMQGLASDAVTSRRAAAKRGNVVVIHGILGAELSSTAKAGGLIEKIWLDYFQLFLGRFNRFRLNESGDADVDPHVTVAATGMLKKYYGEIILLLQRDWNVCEFWFDWRKDLRVSAAQLAAKTAAVFGADAPFHIVAHSMGGLVARSFISQTEGRWKKGSRLIMLGTPNYGSFVVPQIITGLEGIIRKIALVDTHNSVADIAAIANSFPGSYQLLPSPEKLPALEALYDAATWGRFQGVRQEHLTSARRFQAEIAEGPTDGFVYVAGYGHDTLANITDLARVGEKTAYTSTKAGDGRVPHKLGLMDGVPAFYVDAVHAELPMDAKVQRALSDLLDTGACDLPTAPPAGVRGEEERVVVDAPDPDEAELAAIAAQTHGARGASRSVQQEQELAARAEELLVRGWLSEDTKPRTAPVEGVAAPVAEEVPRIEIEVRLASITEVTDADVIGGGVYIGVRPDGAVSILDDAISAAYRGEAPKAEERLITQMLERGVIHGGLGQPFLLPDPRDPKRLIAIAGMGAPGRFGVPECTVLARELAWTLGKIKRTHLATVLIGSGVGNLRTTDAVEAWLRGIRRALVGMRADERLQRVTFIEVDAEKVLHLDEAIRAAQADLQGKLVVDYAGIGDRTTIEQRAIADKQSAMQKEFERLRVGSEKQRMDVPARMTVTFDSERGAYLFGAITSTAAVPEREIALDRRLVEEASRRIANQSGVEAQLKSGDFLRKLLIPRDFRDQLQGAEPLVVLVDRITARTPWEMVVRGELDDAQRADSGRDAFLGIARGLTRQMRTTFAPPPEPPPPVQPLMRVLLVADPAADMPLPGAQREGMELRALFESAGGRVQVTPLLGPGRATRYSVLEAVMQGDFDVLHFAGHCTFNADDPSKSGWIFGKDDFLSANELNRIDRIPRFVFSNACESGVTPDDANLSLGPSFAEAFFLRGVTNFVCTAWPVNDTAALEFARAVYTNLLAGHFMHTAMQHARLAIADKSFGAGTWGAYQHYGNPYYRW